MQMRFSKPIIVALLSITVLGSPDPSGAHDVVLMGPLHTWHGSWDSRFGLQTFEGDERLLPPQDASSRCGRRARFTRGRPPSRARCSEGAVAR